MRSKVSSLVRTLTGAALLFAACATAPKTASSPPRAKDSASEKLAAQRAGGPHELSLEADAERWGIEAARERKAQQDAAKARKQQDAAVGKSVDVTTPPAK
ncbi:MAG TPA: hypothetical protein VIQ54_21635 [Polyangia bacterium]|jgi:hypothetical protein